MKEFKFPFILLFLLLNSCSDDDNGGNIKKIDSYRIGYMHYPTSVMPNTTDDIIYINYDNNGNIIERIGGLVPISSSAGYNYKFDMNLYEDLIYANKEITSIKYYNSIDYTYLENFRKIFLENGRIDKIINYQPPGTDSVIFEYDTKNQIKRTKTIQRGLKQISEFFFNDWNNLDSIITRKAEYNPLSDEYEINYASNKRVVEYFSYYDNAYNPTKPLILFEETFYRALSVNNYRKYCKVAYDENNILTMMEQREWNFFYENGEIRFDTIQ